MVKNHLSTSSIENSITPISGMFGGTIGNTIEAGVDSFETYQDIHNHNYALVFSSLTIYHASETIELFCWLLALSNFYNKLIGEYKLSVSANNGSENLFSSNNKFLV